MPAKINQMIGVLAGEGEIPHRLVSYCLSHDIPICVVQFEGCHYTRFPDIPILKTRIEQVGKIFKFFKMNGVDHVVMIGNLAKPELTSLRPDMRGLKTLMAIGKSYLQGDDNLLRSLRREIEGEGFTVVGVDYYLTDLTIPAGVQTKAQNNKDVSDAVTEALRFGAEDKGQSILLHNDGTYSYETRAGTTALIKGEGRQGSVLIKMVKPQQDPDLDRPTVGIKTLEALFDKKCAGLVVQADGVFLIDKDAMVEFANTHDLFIEAVHG